MNLNPTIAATILLISCGGSAPSADAGPEEARILSAFHGLDALPAAAMFLCAGRVEGADGMPVVFSVRLDDATVLPEMFEVETASGAKVTPLCATLGPATEALERRTVLLAGDFGTVGAPPASVEVVGALRSEAGTSLRGVRTDDVTPLSDGPSLVLAERYDASSPGLVGECPDATTQVVQLTWSGGVSGPMGAALGEAQRNGIMVTLADGDRVTPIALADDDPDNHVHVCLTAASPAQEVAVQPGLFHDPGDDANPATSVDVIDVIAGAP